jgi:hypothetical protein
LAVRRNSLGNHSAEKAPLLVILKYNRNLIIEQPEIDLKQPWWLMVEHADILTCRDVGWISPNHLEP